jgi:uncharacterized protein YndB with AHSA1/START domain
MSTQTRARIQPAPVRKSIFVNAPQDRAFEVFTSGIGRWWPKSHHIGKSDLDRPVLEPKADGRWYELGVDGSQCDVGKVALWDPPARLVLIWQLTAEFTFDPDLVTEVEVQFTPEGSGTRVDLEHRHLERLGETAEKLREAVDSTGGWSGLLALFAEEAAT